MSRTKFGALLGIFLFSSISAYASEPRQVATHGEWAAYVFTENGNKVCYMASKPKQAEGDYTSRGDVFALITHRPGEGTRDVFSYIAGYPYKSGSDVSITVSGTSFTLFTQDDTAWAPDSAADRNLADAIRKGSNMIVKGTSKRGTLTTDTFSLTGSSKAYETISSECGI